MSALYPPARGTGRAAEPRSRQSQLARASVGTAAGTLVSRATGLARLVVAAYALGGGSLADAFNLANNTPNMVHDLVIGGVLAATFVPVFIDRLATRPEAEARESMSAVVSLAAVVLVVTTVLFVLAAPLIIDLYSFGNPRPEERAAAVILLRFFAPQLAFYGAVSLMSAVLATRDRFAVVGFAPVLNNVISLAVLATFAVLANSHAVTSGAILHDTGLLSFLGIGTTLGVAIQALALIPSMRRAGVSLRFVWRPHDPAVRAILALSGWTFGFVVLNQVAVFVVLALQFRLGVGNVTAYTYAYTFFQLPFGVVAVSVINVASPGLARAHALGRLEVMGRRFGSAIRQTLALVLPATVGYLVLARPVVSLVLQHGAESEQAAHTTASVLALFALGLPGFCVYFVAIRAFQAMQDTRTAFVLYALENGVNVLLAFLLYHPLGVRGLALAYSAAYSLGALVALAILRERLGTIGGRALVTSSARSLLLSVAMAFIIAFLSALFGSGSGVGGWARLIGEVLVGGLVYLGGAGLAGSLASWQTSRRLGRHMPRHKRGNGARPGGN